MKTRLLPLLLGVAPIWQLFAAGSTPISIYGAWHCSNDFCNWATVRNMKDFGASNGWIIDRGDGVPSVNLVILSFVNPLKLLHQTSDATTSQGVPIGMTQEVISYFSSKGIRVMVSIGGSTFVDDWNAALAENPTQLGINAADMARRLGVGVEIDYEEDRNPNLPGLQAFIDAYRKLLPHDSLGIDPARRLTIDLAAGDRWLQGITRKATADWLNTDYPVLDYANAMVPARQPSAAEAQANWQEHIDGKARYIPPIPPLAPAKLTGSLYLTDRKPLTECTRFEGSLEDATGTYVQSVTPKGAGQTPGMLGYMFWAAECPSPRAACTIPPRDCRSGVGVGAGHYTIRVPMEQLRQN